eukprot:TRINITY_DN64922_c0_g1_i1.p1 TRINITY_DN64922_c0_g1~~TRINITY_DN64922_c0_g1_i1.p1  ORF type:complete len:822 (+),score=122.54 TRINITY_DN64922_c0_g1_i1:316-2466(+)
MAEESAGMHPLTACFLIVCFMFALYFARTVWNEWVRYNVRNAKVQGCFQDYMKYRFGYWYTWTPGASGIVLCVLSITLLVIGGSLLRILTDEPLSASLWAAWIWIASPDGGGSAETNFGRIVGVFVSCGGMLIFALLMSVVSSFVEDTLANLRNGGLPVIEGDHCVLLGWSPIVPTLISELCSASESRGGIIIALLSPQPKADIEDYLREECDIDFRNSTIIVRTGEIHKLDDMAKVAVESAKTVAILSQPGLSREDADSRTLNVLLTLRTAGWPRHGEVVVQCELMRNQRLFRKLTCPEKTEVLTTGDFVGELMVQASLQRGLAGIIASVLSFEGDEFYIHAVEGAAGRTFQSIMFGLPQAVVVGIVTPDAGLMMLPPMDKIIEKGTKFVLLAEDASTLPTAVSLPAIEAWDAALTAAKSAETVESMEKELEDEDEDAAQLIIVIGWNESIGSMMVEIDNHVGSGSEVLIYGPEEAETRKKFLDAAQKRRNHKFVNFTVTHCEGPLGARFKLEELPLERATKILILADSLCSSASDMDSHTISVILQVQDILHDRVDLDKAGVIVPQILERATEDACIHMNVHDYISSTQLAARIMALVLESPDVSGIIANVLSETGCQFHIRALSDYPTGHPECLPTALATGEVPKVSFNQVAAVAALHGEVALGWSVEGATEHGPWEMNPKDRPCHRPWSKDDRIVTLKHAHRHPAAAASGNH